MMESYRTVCGAGESRFEEKKSIFIGRAIPCETWEEACRFVAEVRKGDPDARHHVSAFINREGNVQRFDDDGEPKGTGGIPMLEVLKKEEVSGVCAVVTRYFGGILLGAGGLARAYARGARDALGAAGICRYVRAFRVKAEIPYPLFSKVEFELNQKKYRICGKEFGEKVSLSLLAEPEEKAALEVLLQDLSGGKISLTVEGDTFVQARKDI